MYEKYEDPNKTARKERIKSVVIRYQDNRDRQTEVGKMMERGNDLDRYQTSAC